MSEILRNFKWILGGLAAGIFCLFTAACLPNDPKGIQSYLTVFGGSLSIGYWFQLLFKIFQPLEKGIKHKN